MNLAETLWTTEKPKLYVGCALTGAPRDFNDNVEAVKEELGTQWRVLNFLGLVAGTASDVFKQDIGNVDECDAFLAITDLPSTGLGMEIGRAVELRKPTLLVAQADTRVTRMVLGAAEMLPEFSFGTYEEMQHDLPPLVNRTFAHILHTPGAHEAR